MGEHNHLSSMLDRVFQIERETTKVKDKIDFQMVEINKTKEALERFQDCLSKQYDVLSKLKEKKNILEKERIEMLKAISILDKDSDDEPSCDNDDCIANDPELVEKEQKKKLKRKQEKSLDMETTKQEKQLKNESNLEEIIESLCEVPDDVTISMLMRANDHSIYACGSFGSVFKYELEKLSIFFSGQKSPIWNILSSRSLIVAVSRCRGFLFDEKIGCNAVTTKNFEQEVLDVRIECDEAHFTVADGHVWALELSNGQFRQIYSVDMDKLRSVIHLPHGVLMHNGKSLFFKQINQTPVLLDGFDCWNFKKLQLGPPNYWFFVKLKSMFVCRCDTLKSICRLNFDFRIKCITFNDRYLLVLAGTNYISIFEHGNDEFKVVKIWRPKSLEITAISISKSNELLFADKGCIFKVDFILL